MMPMTPNLTNAFTISTKAARENNRRSPAIRATRVKSGLNVWADKLQPPIIISARSATAAITIRKIAATCNLGVTIETTAESKRDGSSSRSAR
jgi:hypothetical protein